MNKKVLIAASLLTTMMLQAQESGSGDEVLKNKKGNEILPKKEISVLASMLLQ